MGAVILACIPMTPLEKEHIVEALQFELSKVETRAVRQRMLEHLTKINEVLAAQVGIALGGTVSPSGTADSIVETQTLASATSSTSASGGVQESKALSMAAQPSSANSTQEQCFSKRRLRVRSSREAFFGFSLR